MDPGPLVPDVLYNQAVHRSNDIWNGQVLIFFSIIDLWLDVIIEIISLYLLIG